MKSFTKNLWLSVGIMLLHFAVISQTIENSYVVNQQVPIGGSSLFYVQIGSAPNGAIISNVEVKFNYIAYGVVHNFVSARFNKGNDPGTGGGILLVAQGSLPSGNPGTWGFHSFPNWNGQTGINTNYYFRFNLASSSPYTCTINTIFVKITYIQPNLTVVAPNGGETWYKGTTYQINWASSDISGPIQIDLYKGNNNVLQLAAAAPNTGTYPFNPPSTLADGSNYRIGISALNGTVSDFGDNYFTIATQSTPTITVISPNGGETWYKGTDYQINWSSTNVNGPIQIDLYKGSTNVLQLAAAAPNTGTYPFNPPSTLADGSNYRIGISAMGGTVSDFSDSYFTIATQSTPTITVIIPNGGETWYKGTEYQITWSSSDVTSPIQIDLYKGSTNVLQLAAAAPNTGTYPFNPPSTLADGSDYRIGISAMGGTVSDFSDSYFTIATQSTPTITVISPNGGETWYKGTDYQITWSSSDVTSPIQIDLYKGSTNLIQLAAAAPNTGTYPFNPPNKLADGSDYRIGISAMGSTVSDFSNSYFTIATQSTPTITVISPNGGETWYKGIEHQISWVSSDISGPIQIDLYKENNQVLQLAAAAPNTGTYPFNPPNKLADGSDYRIGISAMGSTVSDFSNSYFTIATQSTPTITVISPNGGETWYKGIEHQISWVSSDISGPIQIDLYKENNQVLQLAATAPNTGTYPFNPPSTLADGSDYRIGISAMGGTVSDFSNSYFTIVSEQAIAAPVLVSPINGGSLMGPVYLFEWESVQGAGAYQLKIADNALFTNPIVNDHNISGAADSYQLNESLVYGEIYFWQMRTLNGAGTVWSEWGQYQVFIASHYTSFEPVDDYPNYYKTQTKCCEDACVSDVWAFFCRECTSFVAWRINRDLGYTQIQANDPFRNHSVFGHPTHLGNAKNWADALQALNINILINNTPAVGALAHWDNGTYGHVAYVQSVNSDNSVNIEEYNFSNYCETMGYYSFRENIVAQRYIHIRSGYGGATQIGETVSKTILSKIYPNPVHSMLTLEFTETHQKLIVSIYNGFGQKMMALHANEYVLHMNLSDLSPGLYTIKIEHTAGIENHTFIKQ